MQKRKDMKRYEDSKYNGQHPALLVMKDSGVIVLPKRTNTERDFVSGKICWSFVLQKDLLTVTCCTV